VPKGELILAANASLCLGFRTNHGFRVGIVKQMVQLLSPPHETAANNTAIGTNADGYHWAGCAIKTDDRGALDNIDDTHTATIGRCSQDAASILPVGVTASGFITHTEYVTEFFLQAEPVNEKPAFASVDGLANLYWSSRHSGQWVFDHDTDDSACSAYVSSSLDLPPFGGSSTWYENFDGDFHHVTLTLEEHLSVDNCASLAIAVSNTAACANAASGTCSVACAEPWLAALFRCASQQNLFYAAASVGPEFTEACIEAASKLIDSAPTVLSVYGTTCHVEYEDVVYVKQELLVSGRPAYVSDDGSVQLYFSDRKGSWILDHDNIDQGYSAISDSQVIDPQNIPSGDWSERCDSEWSVANIQVIASIGSDSVSIGTSGPTLPLALATAPAQVSVSGSCLTSYNGVYLLQPQPLNGMPHYISTESLHLYWTASLSYCGCSAWVLDKDADATNKDRYSQNAFLVSASSSVPVGRIVWNHGGCRAAPPSGWAQLIMELNPIYQDCSSKGRARLGSDRDKLARHVDQ
jgi:hypothetical protein